MGDLNFVIQSGKKRGGKKLDSVESQFFSNLIDDAGLMDLVFVGYEFTWSNKRAGKDFIEARLDRALTNSEWFDLFPRAVVYHPPVMGSDHSPLPIRASPAGRMDPNHLNSLEFIKKTRHVSNLYKKHGS